VVTCKDGEQRAGVVPQKKTILAGTRLEGETLKDGSTDRLLTRLGQRCQHNPTLPLPSLSPAEGHRGRYMHDPQRSQVMQLQAVELQQQAEE
jgi:hypothetical protein